ncbi:MAG TPA: hypothetical protein VN708_11400 [Terriglobales bacterium]|jgi:hypothetical protein|nr:hypothetical protein [Terriglobales bacterium]
MATVNVAVNERAFNDVVMAVAKYLESVPPFSGSGSFGPFSASYSVGLKLTGGSIDLTNTGRVHFDELHLTYDPLILNLGIDLPTIPIGGECILPTPWGCAVRLPEIDLFDANPDISIPINLSNTIVSEFSGEFTVSDSKQVLVAKGSLRPHAAHFSPDTSNEIRDRFRSTVGTIPFLPTSAVNGIADAFVPFVKSNLADKWQFFLHDVWHNLELISISDTAANILRNLTDFIIDKILAPVPSIVRGVVKAILNPIFDAIAAVLDIPDDILEWLSSQLQISFGLFDLLAQLIINFVGSMVPFYQFEDPFPMIEDSSGLLPVLVPVENVSVVVNDDEFVMSADIG